MVAPVRVKGSSTGSHDLIVAVDESGKETQSPTSVGAIAVRRKNASQLLADMLTVDIKPWQMKGNRTSSAKIDQLYQQTDVPLAETVFYTYRSVTEEQLGHLAISAAKSVLTSLSSEIDTRPLILLDGRPRNFGGADALKRHFESELGQSFFSQLFPVDIATLASGDLIYPEITLADLYANRISSCIYEDDGCEIESIADRRQPQGTPGVDPSVRLHRLASEGAEDPEHPKARAACWLRGKHPNKESVGEVESGRLPLSQIEDENVCSYLRSLQQ